MIQGTTSDAGKSTVVAGLCRLLYRQGIRVAPFKPQNMANNSAVTMTGGEIGRAQAVQAQAANLEPHTDMNPVLLKPSTDTGAQVIVHGRALGNMNACDYHDYKKQARKAVLESHSRLSEQYEVIVTEGAGSPAEINLRENDIANMGFAEAVDCPVILVGDIDRGGVFAQLVGTLELLSPSEQARIKGFIINRFRGDIKLLESGLEWLENKTDIPVLGVLPFMHDLHLESEDSVALKSGSNSKNNGDKFKIIVPLLPRISNHTDLDSLRLHPQVDVQYIAHDEAIPSADLIILPGSKSVIHDLDWLKSQGWEQAIKKHLRYGGKIIGICGGFQMLGNMIYDPEKIEGSAESSTGLSLLDIETVLEKEKKLQQVSGKLTLDEASITGYEIHMGKSTGKALLNPAVIVDNNTDGAISPDNQILGTYLHGLFDSKTACKSLLQWAGLSSPVKYDYVAIREASIEQLADMMNKHLDMDAIFKLIEEKPDSAKQQQG